MILQLIILILFLVFVLTKCQSHLFGNILIKEQKTGKEKKFQLLFVNIAIHLFATMLREWFHIYWYDNLFSNKLSKNFLLLANIKYIFLRFSDFKLKLL